MRAELLKLARQLRGRAELLEEDDWCFVEELRTQQAPPPERAEGLEGLAATVEACRRCPLGARRIHPAFGVGSANAEVMFIGEGPGYEEDRKGEPFVGKAGQLLDKILASIGLSRKTVYIANIVKCHPMVDPSAPDKRGNDRPPMPLEMAACREYLDEQIRIVAPRILVALGGVAAKTLLATETGIMKLRGKWHRYEPAGLPLMPTFHPAALLRNPDWKRDVWTDMKSLKRALENRDEDLA